MRTVNPAAHFSPPRPTVSADEPIRGNRLIADLFQGGHFGQQSYMPDSPASVGFALYLVEVKTGARVWRGAFEGTQETDMRLRWLSTEELARNAVKSVLRKLPLQ